MGVKIKKLTVGAFEAAIDDLAEILHACVADGASVGFFAPFKFQDAQAFWRDANGPNIRSGGSVIWVAELEGRVVGTVQLCLNAMPNQTHRGDVSKLLVHPKTRRKGIANMLMQALLDEAKARDLLLLLLDTRSGDPSETLYTKLGFETAGEVPLYAKCPSGAEVYEATTYMYKRLRG
jgi:ribosomal protein S18 acetylase RimI-like enzyme